MSVEFGSLSIDPGFAPLHHMNRPSNADISVVFHRLNIQLDFFGAAKLFCPEIRPDEILVNDFYLPDRPADTACSQSAH